MSTFAVIFIAELPDKTALARPAWLSCLVVVFVADFGDLTQLAAASLAANSRSPLAVGVGAVLALWAVTVIAAVAGGRAARFASGQVLARISAVLFAAVGVLVIATS